MVAHDLHLSRVERALYSSTVALPAVSVLVILAIVIAMSGT